MPLDKKPEEQPEKQSMPKHVPALLLVAAGIGCFALLSGMLANTQHVATPFVVAMDKADNVPEEKRVLIEAEFIKHTAKLAVLDVSDADIQEQVLHDSKLDKEEARLLIQAVRNGDTQLGQITLWDNFDQDGDVVSVSTEGLTVTIPLSHVPQTYYVPFRSGAPIKITGVVDGGGGITAALGTASGDVPLPIMAVGQTIVIPHF